MQAPEARIGVYQRRGGAIVLVFSPNVVPASRLGEEFEPYLAVIYAADRSAIITGYQVESLAEVAIPDGVQWLPSMK